MFQEVFDTVPGQMGTQQGTDKGVPHPHAGTKGPIYLFRIGNTVCHQIDGLT